jgi:hypothetical protein
MSSNLMNLLAIVLAPGISASPATPSVPMEIGVYSKTAGDWTEVEPEIVNWKSGGVLKTVATVGIVKPDSNAHVRGARSPNRASAASEFLVVAPEGVSVTEYQLLRLHTHSNSREFRAVTGGIIHPSGGSDRDLLDFNHRKIASRTYLVTLPASITDGEYGFLPPGAGGSRAATAIGKIYSFRIADENPRSRNRTEPPATTPSLQSAPQRLTALPTDLIDVTFTSTPADALVSISGMSLGYTPLVCKLQSRRYKVAMRLSGYAEWRQEVTVYVGTTTTVNAELKREEPPVEVPQPDF